MRKTTGSHSKRAAANLYLVETDGQLEASRTRKTWTQRDCIDVVPLTDKQKEAFQCWYQRDDSSLTLAGSAGTGKSFLACYLGISEVLDPKSPQKQLIIVRSCTPTKDIGFLPGDQAMKEEVYQLPYVEIFAELFKRKATYKDMVEAGLIRFVSTSFIRGITLDNAIIVADEFQNFSFHEASSVMTRVGRDTRVILCGDSGQSDIQAKRGSEVSGFDTTMRIVNQMDEFDCIKFTHDDIVRSNFVKQWIILSEKYST